MTYQEIVPLLTRILTPGQVSISDTDRALHAKDQSFHQPSKPDVIVWPESALQVSQILILANEYEIPLTAWGAGTSLEGNPIPVRGGILLSLERMNKIIAIQADDFQVTVQPGLGYKDLNVQLARYGLFFAPDPGANASIGGMIANNAAGSRTVRYGATRDNVLRMEVVLADGQVIHVGSRSVKQSAGFDLVHLFIGSEGTLGIITEATLRLSPIPEHISAIVAAFNTVQAAVETVVAVRGSGLDPAALEFLDAFSAQMLIEAEGLDLLPKPTLFMEFHAAHSSALDAGIKIVEAICRDFGTISFQATTNATERKKLWDARHRHYEIVVRTHPDQNFLVTDTCVPLSAYIELVNFIEQQIRQPNRIEAPLVGHAGDGNIHVLIPFDQNFSYERAQQLNAQLVKKAISLGGTCTGEHGVGLGKARFMPIEHGGALEVMRMIKKTLDPKGILNPGKIFLEDAPND